MTYREEQWLLQTTRENNKMLKQIISYINYINSKANSENIDDFGRNILANIVSTQFESKQNKNNYDTR